ncbi:LnmK family bifunctional acyltransferase/decarboxylase [Cypionkella sinensis]|uniref:LnmK family bifunctional acyltransferase/decarboxylase n=1 Tax=Cypionkella sinensis TaxID=1756043 RepID=UPI003625853F
MTARRVQHQTRQSLLAELPLLDAVTLSEDWALSAALAAHWRLLAKQLGRKPSDWFDEKGERMYAAVLWVNTRFDVARPVREDDRIAMTTAITSLRKPHALSETRFVVDGTERAHISALTCFVKRSHAGSNRKLSKVRNVWRTPDQNGARIEDVLDRHHQHKTLEAPMTAVEPYCVNRARDFNAADLFYFRNYIRIAKATEWQHDAGQPPESMTRECWFFGNVDDGERLSVGFGRHDGAGVVSITDDDGQRLFLSSLRLTQGVGMNL